MTEQNQKILLGMLVLMFIALLFILTFTGMVANTGATSEIVPSGTPIVTEKPLETNSQPPTVEPTPIVTPEPTVTPSPTPEPTMTPVLNGDASYYADKLLKAPTLIIDLTIANDVSQDILKDEVVALAFIDLKDVVGIQGYWQITKLSGAIPFGSAVIDGQFQYLLINFMGIPKVELELNYIVDGVGITTTKTVKLNLN